jgi:hypothetical protein
MRALYTVTIVGLLSGCAAAIDEQRDEQPDEVEVESTEGALARNEDSGRTLWSRQLEAVIGVGTDSAGDAYVAGWDLEKRLPTVAKLDPYGALKWRRVMPLYFQASNRAPIAVGRNGEIVIAGATPNDLDTFDLGCDVFEGHGQQFLAQLSTDGQCMWVKYLGGTVGLEAITVDELGRTTLAGWHEAGAWLGPGGSRSAAESFIVQYERDGAPRWGKFLGSSAAGMPGFSALAVDAQENVYAAGTLDGDVDFGGGPITAPRANNRGFGPGFLVQLDGEGNALRQRKLGTGSVNELRLGVRGDGRAAIAGRFYGTLDFDGKTLTNSSGSRDVFIATFTTAGTAQWVKKLWGTSTMSVSGVGIDGWGYTSIAGRFQRTSTQTSATLHIGSYDFATSTYGSMFAAHFTPTTGATVWAREFDDSNALLMPSSAVITPNNGRLLIGGQFRGSIDFGKGMMSSPDAGFLVRLHP